MSPHSAPPDWQEEEQYDLQELYEEAKASVSENMARLHTREEEMPRPSWAPHLRFDPLPELCRS